MSWQELEQGNPDLADFGFRRFAGGVAYLATIRKDGSPRVHPVTPIIGQGHLFVFMEPTSPKGHDLRRDGRYTLHSAVGGSGGEGGEFYITGQARFVEDSELRSLAAAHASYEPAARYILFELHLESAASTVYENGEPIRQAWNKS